VVGVLLLMYIVSYLDRTIVSLMVDPIKHSLGLTDFQIGLVQGAAFAVFYALFGLPMGWLVDRYPVRTVVFCGITVWSLAAAACGLARDFVGLACARLGVGAGEATLVPAAYSTISRLFPSHRVATALAVFSLGSVLGSAGAYLVGGHAIALAQAHGALEWPVLGRVEPWQLVFFATGLPGVLVALLAFAIPAAPRVMPVRGQPAPAIQPLGPFLRRRKAYFGFGLMSSALTAVLAYGAFSWVPAFLMRQHGVAVQQVASMMGIASIVGGTAGFLFSGWAGDRLHALGRRDGHLLPMLFGLPVLMTAATCNFLWVTNMVVFTILLGLMLFTLPLISAFSAHVQITTPPPLRGRVSAVKITVEQLLGISIGPALVSGLSQFVLRDPARLGEALFITYVIVMPLLLLCLLSALKPARVAMDETL
jgi:MFS family permease